MKKIQQLLALLFSIAFVVLFAFSVEMSTNKPDGLLINDVARLYPTYVSEIVKGKEIESLQNAIQKAKQNGLKVSIAGSQHSQGGHTYYDDAVVLQMKDFDKILDLDTENKTITVQSGATWEDIQEYIAPYGLAVKTMQSSYLFTIGGTLSANAHGRDLEKTTVVDTVKSFRLLKADGSIVNVSRTENPELFKLVIGGYGLFGVILDVELELTDDEVYVQESVIIDYSELPQYFEDNIKNNPDIALLLIRPSIHTDPDSFLKETVVLTWTKTDIEPEGIYDLQNEKNVSRDKFFFGLSRSFDWGKNLRWSLQKKFISQPGQTQLVSRNNAMRPPTAPLDFLIYKSSFNTDILQEYYIPTRNFKEFMDEFRTILTDDDMNVVSFTIRYVKPNNETYLSFAPNEEAFAIIFMGNIKTTKKAKAKSENTIRKIVDAAIENDGTYYLTYQLAPTQEQIRAAYPALDLFLEKKLQYDPNELFMNKFYEK